MRLSSSESSDVRSAEQAQTLTLRSLYRAIGTFKTCLNWRSRLTNAKTTPSGR